MKKLGFTRKKKLFSMLCLVPFVVGFIFFTAKPLIDALMYSFSNTRFLPDGTIDLVPVGWDNYKQVIWVDYRFKNYFPGSLRQICYMTPMVVILSLIVAVMLNNIIRGKHFFRAVFFLPVVLLQGPLLSILTELKVFQIEGAGNMFIFSFIKERLPELISTPILYIVNSFTLIVWHSGVPILVCLAGLQKTDKSLYEAAQVDGASGWQIFWKLTLPISKPFLLLSAVYTIVDIATIGENEIIQLIKTAMFEVNSNGFGFSSATTWIYFLTIIACVAVAYLLIMGFRRKNGEVSA